MTKDEALDLALEALLRSKKAVSGDLDLASCAYGSNDPDGHRYTDAKKALSTLKQAITAIKQARALDKMAENARELGLDYEPVGLIDRLTNPEDHYEFTDPKKANAVLMSLCQEAADALAAPVQPVALPTDAQIAATAGRIGGFSDEAALGKQWDDVYLLVRRVITEITTATPPAAPVQDLFFGIGGGLVAIKTLLSRDPCVHANTAIEMIDAILSAPAQPAPVQPVSGVVLRDGLPTLLQDKHIKETDQRLCIIPPAQPAPVQDCFWKREGYKECPAAQPAVPDAMTSADTQEHIEYVAGWNECRQAMLEMMK
jgi:hypothetical protein